MLDDVQIGYIKMLIEEEIIKLTRRLNYSVTIEYKQSFNNNINFCKKILDDLEV